METPVIDKTQAEPIPPVVINPVTVDEYQDAALLKPVELSQEIISFWIREL